MKTLVVPGSGCYLMDAMKRWSSRQVFLLLLGAFLALGMSLSAVQAGEMSVKMAVASDARTSGQGSCDGCGARDDSANTMSCPPALYCTGSAVLPAERTVAVTRPSKPFIAIFQPSRDLGSPPDPYPPRFLALV